MRVVWTRRSRGPVLALISYLRLSSCILPDTPRYLFSGLRRILLTHLSRLQSIWQSQQGRADFQHKSSWRLSPGLASLCLKAWNGSPGHFAGQPALTGLCSVPDGVIGASVPGVIISNPMTHETGGTCPVSGRRKLKLVELRELFQVPEREWRAWDANLDLWSRNCTWWRIRLWS